MFGILFLDFHTPKMFLSTDILFEQRIWQFTTELSFILD